MKKLFLLVAVVAMVLPSCKKINEAIDGLDSRLDKLEQETIPSIDEQISAINTTLGNLDAMDKELKGYIDNLTATASSLQEQINATNTKIDAVKAELQGEISTAKSEILAQLATVKTELENELAQINSTIETLKAKDTELDNKIAELRSYVDTELGKTTDWVNATFATLEQYNSLVSEVATIKEQIQAIKQSITDLETRLTTKINEDIANAVSTLNADIQQKVSEITDAYTNAVKTAKEEITTAYTTAIQNAINALDSSLKSWVGEQLSNYYTIAEVNAKISALQTAINDGDATLQEELSKLKSQLETTATEITAAYKKAIEEAINTNNGVIDTKIANEIATVNQRITNEVATINAKIAEIESRLDNVEAKIAELLARIQSITYLPEYSDGAATINYIGNLSKVSLDFKISPKECAAELAKVWQTSVSCEALYTKTRTASLVAMPTIAFEADAECGVITVTASGENLSEEFFSGNQEARIAIVISDGNNNITSDYIPMVTKEITNEIWYTSDNGEVVYPNNTDAFDSKIISNTYTNGLGVICFEKEISKIGDHAFSDTNLTKVTLPNGIKEIGIHAFSQCWSLQDIVIPNGVIKLGYESFRNCPNIKNIIIPNSVTEIGDFAFHICHLESVTMSDNIKVIGAGAFSGCTRLKEIKGQYASLDNRCLIIDNKLAAFAPSGLTSYSIQYGIKTIGEYVFYNCGELEYIYIPNSVTQIESSAFENTGISSINLPNTITEISYGTFSRCQNLTSVVIPNSVETICSSAFAFCPNLTNVTIPESVTDIDGNPFLACEKLAEFNGKYASNDSKCLIVNGKIVAFAPYGVIGYNIPDGVTCIGTSVFSLCSTLTNITIPNSVTSIDVLAFERCDSLKEIYCMPTTPPTGDVDMFSSNAADRKIYVPTASVEAYKAATYWSDYADYIVGYDFE